MKERKIEGDRQRLLFLFLLRYRGTEIHTEDVWWGKYLGTWTCTLWVTLVWRVFLSGKDHSNHDDDDVCVCVRTQPLPLAGTDPGGVGCTCGPPLPSIHLFLFFFFPLRWVLMPFSRRIPCQTHGWSLKGSPCRYSLVLSMYRCICIQVHCAFRLYHLPQTRDIASNNWHSCSLLSGGVNTMYNTTILQYTCETALVWQRKTDTRSTDNSHSYSLAPAILNNFLTNAINSDIMSSSFPRSRRWHRHRWSCDLTLLRLPPPTSSPKRVISPQ